MSSVLTLANLEKSFGAVKVADDLNFSLQEGQALGVIGPNGAGKTSMFNLVTGTLAPDSGQVNFKGRNINSYSAAQRCRAGIARSFQVPQPFTHMTVFENAMVAATQAAGLVDREAEHQCLHVLEQTGMLAKANALAGALTLLERKRLELTRALCTRPKLLLLDEIAGGLTDSECGSLIETISSIHRSGVSIIWIEHVVHALLAVVGKLIVIDFGRKIAEGEPREIMERPEVKEIYLGIDADG